MSRIVIIGGGPGGYEAALVAAQLDADVTLVEADGAGGAWRWNFSLGLPRGGSAFPPPGAVLAALVVHPGEGP